MRFIVRMFIVSVLMVLIDRYFFRAVKGASERVTLRKQKIISYVYWSYTGISIVAYIFSSSYVFNNLDWPRWAKMYSQWFLFIVVVAKVIGSVPILVSDISRLYKKLKRKFSKQQVEKNSSTTPIPRSAFIHYVALGMAAIPVAGLISAMAEAFNFKLHKVKIKLPNLPSSFNGLKIVQISDIHAGSFASILPIKQAIDIVLKQNADIIFFTGDLVNNYAKEINPFLQILSSITAPMGVFSILGNHDYQKYFLWKEKGEKEEKLQPIKKIYEQLGWKLLLNEHVALTRGNDSLALIGVENWGAKFRHPKFGDLKKACEGTENYPVRILLSHDPSHWEEKVITEHKNIDLTLSGHTHGFQCGVEVGKFQWSPGEYIYKYWAGLYAEGNQQLYVNRGLGFLGFPGRIGILPEITVIELSNT